MVRSVLAKTVVSVSALWLCCTHNPWTAGVNGEYYSSVEQMRLLLSLEESLIARLDGYIRVHEQKLEILHQQRDALSEEWKKAQSYEMHYVSYPITAFLLTNRLMTDWERLRLFIGMEMGQSTLTSIAMPTVEDLQGIAEGMARLHEIYEMEPNRLADGTAFELPFSRPLTSTECYLIGFYLSTGGHYQFAIGWLEEALRRWTVRCSGLSKVDILNNLAYALFRRMRYGEALELTEQVLELDPSNARALLNKEPLEKWTTFDERFQQPTAPLVPDYSKFHSLCRGDFRRPASELAHLRCRYEHNNTPFLTIAPLKMEEISLDPFIVMYHEAISDREIAILLKYVKPLLTRSQVGTEHKHEVSKSRTSSNGWLDDTVHPFVMAVSQRTVDMTGLSVEGAEQLQVGNYGVGGLYMPHYDYIKSAAVNTTDIGKDDRIATVMYYLSDVDIGGATVFPAIGVSVFPRKGSAVFWYNLLQNGNLDERSMHGACPVLLGSKWVANKWIHERGQEFRRPCALDCNA